MEVRVCQIPEVKKEFGMYGSSGKAIHDRLSPAPLTSIGPEASGTEGLTLFIRLGEQANS